MPRLTSAAHRKTGSPKGKGSGKKAPPKQGLSPAQRRAATIAAKNAKNLVEAEDYCQAGEDSSEQDTESSEKESGGDDGTDGSSSGSEISEDTHAELVKVMAARKAAKKLKTPGSSARTRRVLASVNKFISWLSKSTFTLLPAPLPVFNRAESHLALVYTAALLTFSGRVPQGSQVRHDYETYLSLLDVVQRYLPQLFSETPEALPIANLHVFDTMLEFKAQLDEAFRMLEGQQRLIDLTFSAFTTQLCADGDAFDPLAAIVKLMSSLSNSVLAKQTKIEMNDTFSGARGRCPAFQQQYRHQQHQQGYQQHQQHVGGQQPQPEWSEEYGMLCREPELFDGRTLQWACVKCGAGAYWGAKGHNAADCPASDAEIEAWVHHGQAAP